MGRVQTNSIGLAYAREASPGVLPAQPKWRIIEPNQINNFGADIKTVAREPISKSRQRRKGSVVDLDSPLEFDADLTLGHIRDFIEAFCYSAAIGPDAYEPTGVSATGYTVAALNAAQAGRLIYGAGNAAKSLIYARGFKIAGNNGLKPVSAAHANGAVELKAAGTAVEAIDAKQLVEVAIAGVRGAPGDLRIDANGDLISTALNFTLLGLTPGQVIHIGGVDVANRFFETENSGMARIAAIAPNKITLERTAQAFVTDDGTIDNNNGAGVAIDILFGQFVRNVDVDHPDYREITNQIELSSPNLGNAGATNYEYATGNYADALTATIPLTEKATLKLGFVGLDTVPPSAVRATNAADAKEPGQTGAFGTASDIARLRLIKIDETGLSTDFKSLSIALKNNAAGEKVLGKLGNKYVNAGQLQIDLDAEMLFTEPAVIAAIRANQTVGLDFTLRNDDGGIHIDIPSATIGGGKRNFRANESVTIQGQIMAFKDPTLGTSIGVSLFPILPSN